MRMRRLGFLYGGWQGNLRRAVCKACGGDWVRVRKRALLLRCREVEPERLAMRWLGVFTGASFERKIPHKRTALHLKRAGKCDKIHMIKSVCCEECF